MRMALGITRIAGHPSALALGAAVNPASRMASASSKHRTLAIILSPLGQIGQPPAPPCGEYRYEYHNTDRNARCDHSHRMTQRMQFYLSDPDNGGHQHRPHPPQTHPTK